MASRATTSVSSKTTPRVSAVRSVRMSGAPIRVIASRAIWPSPIRFWTPRTTTESCGAGVNTGLGSPTAMTTTAPTRAAVRLPEHGYRAPVRVCAADLAAQQEFPHVVRRDRSARRAERPVHHRRTAAAPDHRRRDVHPDRRRRILFPAEHLPP